MKTITISKLRQILVRAIEMGYVNEYSAQRILDLAKEQSKEEPEFGLSDEEIKTIKNNIAYRPLADDHKYIDNLLNRIVRYEMEKKL